MENGLRTPRQPEQPDADTLECIVESEEPSFEAFFRAQYRGVLALALCLCGSRPLAEDLAQEAFVSAFRHWRRVSRYDDPTGWVRHVVANRATSSWRVRARELRAVARVARRRDPVAHDAVAEPGFWDAVRELPRRQAQCIALRYVDDMSNAEIAALLGIARATVRVHLHDARAALAARFGDELDEETP